MTDASGMDTHAPHTGGAREPVRAAVAAIVALPLLAAAVLMASRVGDTARFVTWPVVAFTLFSAAVAIVGLWFGLDRPRLLAVGMLPSLVVLYVLPSAPLAVAAVVLAALAALAVRRRGVAAGMAVAVGAAMVLFTALQGPVVSCGRTGASTNSGPWWIPPPSSSSGSGTSAPDGVSAGTMQVGNDRYAYVCASARLTHFTKVR